MSSQVLRPASPCALAVARLALAAVPLALAVVETEAQVTLTGVEVGMLDVSGGRFVKGSAASVGGDFNIPGFVDFSSTDFDNGFTLSGGVTVSGAPYSDGEGENVAENGDYQRYIRVSGTWEGGQLGNQSLDVQFSGAATYTGAASWVSLHYVDQSLGFYDHTIPGGSGQSYSIGYQASSNFTQDARGNFTLELIYRWSPSPEDASSVLADDITLTLVAAPVPEPSSAAALAGLGGLGVAVLRRRRHGY